MVKGLIFDADGTLIDSMPDFYQMVGVFLSNMGLPAATNEDIKKSIGKGALVTMRTILSLQGYTIKDEAQEKQLFADFMAIYNNSPLDKSVLWSNVKTTLDLLQNQGYIMAICTNKPHLPALHTTERLDIAKYFAQITDADSSPYMKPDERIVEFTADKMKVSVSDCVFIGDSSTDIKTAKNCSIPSILVSYGYEPNDITTLGADYIIDDFSELPDVLKKIDGYS